MQRIFRVSDEASGLDYDFCRNIGLPSHRKYCLERSDGKVWEIKASHSKKPGENAFEKNTFNEDHGMEIISTMILQGMKNPGPATLQYIRDVPMSKDDLRDFHRRLIPKNGIVTPDRPVYAGSPLIENRFFVLGLSYIYGYSLEELMKQSDILDAFYKIGFFCGEIKTKFNLRYSDLHTGNFLIDKKGKLYVLDLGDNIRFFEKGEAMDEDYFLRNPNYQEWFFSASSNPKKAAGEFVEGWGEGAALKA